MVSPSSPNPSPPIKIGREMYRAYRGEGRTGIGSRVYTIRDESGIGNREETLRRNRRQGIGNKGEKGKWKRDGE